MHVGKGENVIIQGRWYCCRWCCFVAPRDMAGALLFSAHDCDDHR